MGAEPTELHINQARDLLGFDEGMYLRREGQTLSGTALRKVARLIAQRDTERAEHEAAMQRVSGAFCKVVAIAERVNGYQSARTVIKSLAAPFILPDPTPTPEQVLAEAAPIPMILHCPECGGRHIDEGVFADKPHHTHACQHCGMVWRPAKVDTCGVQFLPGYSNVAPIKDTHHD